jgi:dTDP-4-dehydrorhamnose reductase
MIHVSTDCVFNGRKGKPYREGDPPDAEDLYGRSKLLGEVAEAPGITLRTSIIGRELKGTSGLVEWFLSQGDVVVKGFSKALYTGFTTLEMAYVIEMAMKTNLPPGLYQVSSNPISKHGLLRLMGSAYGLGTRVSKDEEFVCDRRLDSSNFRRLTGFEPKPWERMIREMAYDVSPYGEWRTRCSSMTSTS